MLLCDALALDEPFWKRCVISYTAWCFVWKLYTIAGKTNHAYISMEKTFIVFTAQQQIQRRGPLYKIFELCSEFVWSFDAKRWNIFYIYIWESVWISHAQKLWPSANKWKWKWTNRKYLSACLTNIIWIGTTVHAAG